MCVPIVSREGKEGVAAKERQKKEKSSKIKADRTDLLALGLH